MKYEEIEPHIIDYIQGTLDESIEYRIKAYIKENPDFQKEIDELKDTLDFVADVPLEEPDPKLKMEFYAMLNSYQADNQEEKASFWATILEYFQSKTFTQRALPIASVILLIFLAGYFTSDLMKQQAADTASSMVMEETAPENIAAKVPADDSDSKPEEIITESNSTHSFSMNDSIETIALADEEVDLDDFYEETEPELMDVSDEISDGFAPASSVVNPDDPVAFDDRITQTVESDERIQNIYTSLETKNQDEMIIQALIKALNNDPNPNVRIAAIDALEKFADKNQVKYLIAKSLGNQSSATVQLATLDLIVKYQIKEGAQSIKKLLIQPELNQTVRQQAEIALEIIS